MGGSLATAVEGEAAVVLVVVLPVVLVGMLAVVLSVVLAVVFVGVAAGGEVPPSPPPPPQPQRAAPMDAATISPRRTCPVDAIASYPCLMFNCARLPAAKRYIDGESFVAANALLGATDWKYRLACPPGRGFALLWSPYNLRWRTNQTCRQVTTTRNCMSDVTVKSCALC